MYVCSVLLLKYEIEILVLVIKMVQKCIHQTNTKAKTLFAFDLVKMIVLLLYWLNRWHSILFFQSSILFYSKLLYSSLNITSSYIKCDFDVYFVLCCNHNICNCKTLSSKILYFQNTQICLKAVFWLWVYKKFLMCWHENVKPIYNHSWW